jgi:hypothetical protein
LEKGYPLCLNKLESPLPKYDLCQDWLKLAQWFWRRRFSNILFEKDLALHFPFTQGQFVPSLVDFGPVVLEKRI